MTLSARLGCFILFLYTVESIAQQHFTRPEPVKVTFYYDAVWALTTRENSIYRREALFDLTDMVFDGVFSDYNKNDELIADGIYNHGEKSGIHTEYADHKVKRKIEYSGKEFTIWEWNDDKGEGIKNGSGKFSTVIFYFKSEDGQLIPKQGLLDGEFQNGRRVGRWIYHDFNKNKTDEEIYSKGKLMRHVRYAKGDSVESREGKAFYLSLNSLNTEILWLDKTSFTNLNQYFEKYVTYPPSFNRAVTYPQGLKHLLTLLANAVMAPERNIEVLRVKIDEHGTVVRSTVVRSISLTYDNLTERIFAIHQNRMFPAMRNGKPVESVIYLPIASGDEWMQTLRDAPQEWFLDPANFE